MLTLSILLPFFLHILVVMAHYSDNLPPDADFGYLQPLTSKPVKIYKTDNNIILREGDPSHPCNAGEPCWQWLNDRQYAILKLDKVNGQGKITFTPKDTKKLPYELTVVSIAGTSMRIDSTSGGTDRSAQLLKVDFNNPTVVNIVFSDEIKDMKAEGAVSLGGSKSGQHQLIAPYDDSPPNSMRAHCLVSFGLMDKLRSYS